MNQNPIRQQSTSIATASTAFLRPHKKQQSSIANFIHKPMPMSKSKMLVKMIVKEYHPFSVVEDEEFRNLIKMLSPTYIIPSRKKITQSLLPQMFDMTVECVKDRLKNVEAVCLTTDGWTSRTN
ncbi:zinc finger BED domain-containing protein 6-like [Sipha flava]|jgi:hypothetical protein|uniref:Zinc finger BED domain-containing protein 6 n=1 Tax=Sipha flava TaxID=143950 RepID=A0A2S2PV66_9HEMI|nr:zinc finger BED domain-containing protein 6-like [Sipha flava]